MRNLCLLVADRHELMRQGLRALFRDSREFTVIGEALDGVAAIKRIEQDLPDVALVDLNLPAMNGLEVASYVAQHHLKTKVIVFSVHDDTIYALRALQAGARGYLLKDSDAEEIFFAVRQVGEGKLYVNPLFSNVLLDALLHPGEHPLPPGDGLTLREHQVLQMIAEGETNAQIALKLTISRRTVETHRANLMRKLCARSQAELMRLAITRGLV